MCCGQSEKLNLPAEVIEDLARYRHLLADRGWDWGDDRIEAFRWPRLPSFAAVFAEFEVTGDWAGAVRAEVRRGVPAGVALVTVAADGALGADTGPAQPAIPGRAVRLDVVVDSAAGSTVDLTVAGQPVRVPAGGAAVTTVHLAGADPRCPIVLAGQTLLVDGAFYQSPAGQLQLSAPRCVRWSVTDSAGGGWFPDGVLPKWDAHHRPFFHGHQLTVPVPAEPLRVTCTRGIEYERVELDVHPAAGATLDVDCDPVRLVDPAAAGWYGGDLHVHLNYSGDLVCTPEDAARMQLGEGLHLLNLLAGNCRTSLVYDRAMLEHYAGTDLPWSTVDVVARVGVEYRNDLLGHVHALGPSGPPSRFYTGHERSDHPEDWPPNAEACAELRELGATVGYCHPAADPFPADWSIDGFFARPRTVEARELVADAALGLVDSVDLISPYDDEGAIFLYHRLLSCGLRLAATAGTDVFLSFSHGPATMSNPPGWGRVYAQLGDQPLSVPAFQQAVRAGRTVVSNGPWLTLQVNGAGPGDVLDLAAGDRLDIRARVAGAGAEQVTIIGPDGELATRDVAAELAGQTTVDGPASPDGVLATRGALATGDPAAELTVETTVDGPVWIAAVARGSGHPNTLDRAVLAHTSPVYVDVAGRRVARAADARWCLAVLDRLERHAAEHGHFHPDTRAAHLGDLVAVLDRARAYYRAVAAAAAG